MSDRAWMPLYIGDYNADTGHLTVAEHGAYLMLIMHYWQHGGLPADERMIARVSRMTAEQWAASRDVLAMLFSEGWTHKRIDAELDKATAIIAKRKAAADAMHDKRRANAHAEQVQSKCSDTRGTTYHHTPREDVGANAPTSPEPAKAAPVASSPMAIELPTVSGEPFPVTEADVDEWREAFPAVDVRQQLAAMRSWLVANPTRRKTKRGMRKFVVSWLDRRQNEGGSPPRANGTGPPHGKRPNAVEAGNLIAEEIHERASHERGQGDVELLPPDEPRLRHLVADVGRSLRWDQ
jgi:uncharacterized protein YdaU (DUF1376 family)